jgi:hypothetical protein
MFTATQFMLINELFLWPSSSATCERHDVGGGNNSAGGGGQHLAWHVGGIVGREKRRRQVLEHGQPSVQLLNVQPWQRWQRIGQLAQQTRFLGAAIAGRGVRPQHHVLHKSVTLHRRIKAIKRDTSSLDLVIAETVLGRHGSGREGDASASGVSAAADVEVARLRSVMSLMAWSRA